MIERLRLEPISTRATRDVGLVAADDHVWPWYDAKRPDPGRVEDWVAAAEVSWRRHGAHKWVAYHRRTDEVVGRGGVSRVPMDDDWGRLERFLPDRPWVGRPHGCRHPYAAYAEWVEIGWALGRAFWGQGFASEIGRAGLAFALTSLDARAAVSCTARSNDRSRAVMSRLGLRHIGGVPCRGRVVDDGGVVTMKDVPFDVFLLRRCEWEQRSAPPDNRSTTIWIFDTMFL